MESPERVEVKETVFGWTRLGCTTLGLVVVPIWLVVVVGLAWGLPDFFVFLLSTIRIYFFMTLEGGSLEQIPDLTLPNWFIVMNAVAIATTLVSPLVIGLPLFVVINERATTWLARRAERRAARRFASLSGEPVLDADNWNISPDAFAPEEEDDEEIRPVTEPR